MVSSKYTHKSYKKFDMYDNLSSVGGSAGFRRIDLLHSSTKFSAEHQKLLHEVFARYAQKLSIDLSKVLNHKVIVSLESINTVEFGSYIDTLPTPITIIIGDLKLTKALIILDPYFMFVTLDLMLGGIGEPPMELRELTRIENKLFSELIAKKIVKAYTEIWSYLTQDVNMELDRVATSAGSAMVFPYNEQVTLISFMVRLDELEGPTALILPFTYLKNLLTTVVSSTQKVKSSLPPVSINPEIARRISSAASAILGGKPIEYSKVEIIVELGEAEVTFGDLINLEIGDIIMLETKQSDLIKVKVSGKTKFLGKPGVLNNKYSVRIEKILTEEEAEVYDQPRW